MADPIASTLAAAARDGGGLLDLYQAKLAQVGGLVPETLQFVAAVAIGLAWWRGGLRKAVMAGVAAGIVLALTGNLPGLGELFTREVFGR